MNNNILQYELKKWNTADLLRGPGIKESELPSFMIPFLCVSAKKISTPNWNIRKNKFELVQSMNGGYLSGWPVYLTTIHRC